MYLVIAAFARFWYSSAWQRYRWQSAIALLLEPQRRMGARKLALEQHHLVVPGHRHEVHVAQAPVVVLLADARRARLRRRLRLEPGDELGGCLRGRRDRLAELGSGAGRLRGKIRKVGDLLLQGAGPGDPQVVRVAGEIGRACASNGGMVRSWAASRAASAFESGNVYCHTSTRSWCTGPRAPACRSAPSRPSGRTRDRAPRAAAHECRSRGRSSGRGPARSRSSARPAMRPDRGPRAASGTASARHASSRPRPPCNPAPRRAAEDARTRATARRAPADRRTCPSPPWLSNCPSIPPGKEPGPAGPPRVS